MKQKYPSVHKYYDVTVTDNGQGIATGVSCTHKKGDDPDKKAGIYFLRTSLNEKQELLAYWLVSTIRYQLKQKGYNSDWREIIRKMSTRKCVTTSMTNIENQVISVRKCTEPIREAKKIYDMLNFKYAPFYRKKFLPCRQADVVLPDEILKMTLLNIRKLRGCACNMG